MIKRTLRSLFKYLNLMPTCRCVRALVFIEKQVRRIVNEIKFKGITIFRLETRF